MIILGYVGDHKNDGPAARAGWALVRAAQYGATFQRVTHVEAVLAGRGRHCAIASSSLRDGGIRTKPDADLTPEKWIVADIPLWDVERSIDWFAAHDGLPYDPLGATASVLWFLPHSKDGRFCNESIAESQGVIDPHRQHPASFFAAALSMPGSRIITPEFFAE